MREFYATQHQLSSFYQTMNIISKTYSHGFISPFHWLFFQSPSQDGLSKNHIIRSGDFDIFIRTRNNADRYADSLYQR